METLRKSPNKKQTAIIGHPLKNEEKASGSALSYNFPKKKILLFFSRAYVLSRIFLLEKKKKNYIFFTEIKKTLESRKKIQLKKGKCKKAT